MASNFVVTPEDEKEGHPQQQRQSNDPKDRKLKQFIEEFKLHQIEQQLFTEGITTDFLISQNEQQIEEIAKEPTSSTIQQNKFKYAVSQIK